jgi:hypothetical protein
LRNLTVGFTHFSYSNIEMGQLLEVWSQRKKHGPNVVVISIVPDLKRLRQKDNNSWPAGLYKDISFSKRKKNM